MQKLLLIALFSVPAFAVTLDGDKLLLDQREQALMPQCEAQGGCAVISRAEFQQYVMMVRQQWEQEITEQFGVAVKAEAAKVCRNTI